MRRAREKLGRGRVVMGMVGALLVLVLGGFFQMSVSKGADRGRFVICLAIFFFCFWY